MGVSNSRPTPSPSKATHSIEPSASSGPAHGQGLYHQLLDRFGDDIRIGRVDDLYNSYLCANVTVHGRIANLPCLWLEAAAGRWMGAKSFVPPAIGTEVIVWLPQDGKFGVILGAINPPDRGEIYIPTQLGYTPVNFFDDKSKQNAEQWEMQGFLIKCGIGAPQDIFPGDSITTNEVHSAIGMLKFLSVIRGSENSKIEAYALDDLLRIVAHNFQQRMAASEQEVMVDYGEVDDIIERTVTLAEGLGQDEFETQAASDKAEVDGGDIPDPVSGDVGRWRHKRFFGKLAHMLQDFVLRPHSGPSVLPERPDQDKPKPDLGLRQNVVEMGGYEVTRTLTGIRLHKCRAIAVPKRIRYPDDLDGETKFPDRKPIKRFNFKGGDWEKEEGPGPVGRVAQLRDEAAYLYNKMFPQRFLEKPKDWDVPDEGECPTLNSFENPVPQIGGFYREYGQMYAVSGEVSDGGSTYNNEGGDDPRITAQGDSMIDLNDDGSILLKDNWGSELRLSGGHIVLSASKDIQIFAGGSLINLAGDDFIARSKNSMDFTTSKGQMRLYSTEDLFMHSAKGGMLISTESRGYKYTHEAGEKRKLSGIMIRSGPEGALGGFQVKASNATFSLEGAGTGGAFYVGPVDLGKDSRPDFITRVRGAFHWVGVGDDGVGFEVWKMGKDSYVEFYDGGIFNSDRIHTDGSLEVRKSGIFGEGVTETSDWSKVKTLKELIEEAKSFEPGLWKQFPYPYRDEDAKKVDFTFRTSRDCATATADAFWVEPYWQRDLRKDDRAKPGTWGDTVHEADSSRPYPGYERFYSTWWQYDEVNLDIHGKPKIRGEISDEGGAWSRCSWDELIVHPDR